MEVNETSPSPGPRSRKGERTRRQLLEAARAVFEERGYFETRVADIVQRGDIALGSFYRYFNSKDELLLALLEDVIAELYQSTQGIWDEQSDPLTNLQQTTERYLQAYRRNGRLIRTLLQMAALSPYCASVWWNMRQKTYQQMRAHLPPAAEAYGDLDLLISALGGMVEEFARYWYIEAQGYGHAEPDPSDASRILAQTWYRAVYGS